ncbi:hypothetical protein AN191_16695 [Loktanella sp. 5RATIMAR09]|nr:hypothetical protein AN191_16695 [Loktanella sp. 5RATIMAR09]
MAACILNAATAGRTQSEPDWQCEMAELSTYLAQVGGADVFATPNSPGATPVQAEERVTGTCIACHSNAGFLMGAVTPPEAPPEDGCAAAPSRPAFLNAFVRPGFPDSLHGQIGCVACHGGDDSASDAAAAHSGMTDANATCASCHADQAERHETSLHGTLSGMAHALRLRSGDENFHTLDPMWQADCASCHADCSDCHVTLPQAVGGGLLSGHEFFGRPPMDLTCASCHGSRAGAEYLGLHEGIAADVHFEAGMHCVDCHTNDLHGDGTLYETRWQVEGRAQCTDCHAALPNRSVPAHMTGHDDVSCQVCHAQPYQGCFDCHSGEEDGAYFRRAGSKSLDLTIGRNTAEGYPYGFVTLRSNPVARDSFDHFGAGLLPHFDDYPTWKTAAPHNIRRVTEQNRTCAGCHDNPDLYLSPADLDPEGAAANINATVPPD